MKKYIIFLVIPTLLTACATPLTKEGRKIHITPPNSVHLQKCEMLGPVSLSVNVGGLWNTAERRKALKHSLRNKTAELHPNADTVAYNDLDSYSSSVEIMAIAFQCFGNTNQTDD